MPPAPRKEDRRVAGRPTSSNGASSFHLHWPPPPAARGPVTSVSATVEILTPPTTSDLYFWALQASFLPAGSASRATGPVAGAHLGLQQNSSCPDARGANWGGYAADGTILSGTPFNSPSPLACGNTGGYAWQAGVPYRLTIGPPAADGGWPGRVADPHGCELELRRLAAGGCALGAVSMWTEAFCDCSVAGVAARWSRMQYGFEDGSTLDVGEVSVNYQTHEAGGCSNTESRADKVGFVQRTAVNERRVQTGETIVIEGVTVIGKDAL